MGAVEQNMYALEESYGERDTLARKILRGGAVKIKRDYYKWRGQYYWIVGGRVLTREEGQKLEDERRIEGRMTEHETRIRTQYGD